MEKSSCINYYLENVKNLDIQIAKGKKLITYLSVTRLLTFVVFVTFLALYVFHKPISLFLGSSLLGLLSFLFVVKLDLSLVSKLKILENRFALNKEELRYLKHDFNNQYSGVEYKILNPHLVDDFDIFGKGSLFQYLNRCFTKLGKDKLAKDLCRSELDREIIKKKQEAIGELSEKIDFVQDFQAHAMLISETGNELVNLQAWLNEPVSKLKFLKVASVVCPLISCLWIGAVVFGFLTFNSLLLPILVNMLVVGSNMKLINAAHARVGRLSSVLQKYTALIKFLEEADFKALYLLNLKKQVTNENVKASFVLRSLSRLLNSFDLRFNWMVSITLNALFLFDIQILFQLNRWKGKYKQFIPNWFSVLSEVEPLMSFAVFAFNNKPHVSYSDILDSDFKFKAQDMGHPLLSPSVRVNNSVDFGGTPCVNIITGANMAGKSTFLRTLATNLMLSMNGAPACAKSFAFTPCEIMSSIKIQDSLSNNESYFYAELLRIKEVIDHVRNQPKTLVILDEILRGTNTKDKQLGSLGLLEKLISLNAVVMIATHDLVIGELENKYPYHVNNKCFEVELEDDQLVFDYKLKNGISQKLNASFLMKKMEIMD
jgi:DNA mismatch repair ATPase MutS